MLIEVEKMAQLRDGRHLGKQSNILKWLFVWLVDKVNNEILKLKMCFFFHPNALILYVNHLLTYIVESSIHPFVLKKRHILFHNELFTLEFKCMGVNVFKLAHSGAHWKTSYRDKFDCVVLRLLCVDGAKSTVNNTIVCSITVIILPCVRLQILWSPFWYLMP